MAWFFFSSSSTRPYSFHPIHSIPNEPNPTLSITFHSIISFLTPRRTALCESDVRIYQSNVSNGVGDAPFRIQAAGVSQEYRECSSLHPGCRAEAIPHSLRVSLEILQHSHGELGHVFSVIGRQQGKRKPPCEAPWRSSGDKRQSAPVYRL